MDCIEEAAKSLLAVVYFVDNGLCSICKGHWPNEHRESCQGKRLADIIGIPGLHPVDPKALEEYERAMREEAIPEMLEDARYRQRMAEEARKRVL